QHGCNHLELDPDADVSLSGTHPTDVAAGLLRRRLLLLQRLQRNVQHDRRRRLLAAPNRRRRLPTRRRQQPRTHRQDATPTPGWPEPTPPAAIVWQEQDSQSTPNPGRPLSESFAASTPPPAGPLAIGSTENYSNGRNELLGVQTDASGTVSSCSQIHPASTLA